MKSEEPTGWRRKLTPMPCTGSNRSRMVFARTSGARPCSTAADESVMDAPKPSTAW
ncbi:hypothetical protein NUG22_00470 [Saccharothrix longispora]|nr:hypothetical protein [Saccharothrix longispora]MDU0287662.1 hypothetical protein [Saccharothrix longispora]